MQFYYLDNGNSEFAFFKRVFYKFMIYLLEQI